MLQEYHDQQVYQRGALGHFSVQFPFLICFVIMCMWISSKPSNYYREKGS